MAGDLVDNSRMAISKRLVLRSGFSIIIGLLVISTVMAWRVQESFSSRSVEIHRRFVHEQELLTNLRRALWDVGVRVRDHYLDPEPNADKAIAEMKELQAEAAKFFADLRDISQRPDVVSALELQFADIWSAARTGVQLEGDPAARYSYIQNEIIPRRNEAGRLLREIEKANHSSLAASEEDFRETRSGATQRLVSLLAISLIAGVLVAHFSTRYAERLEQEAQDRFAEVSDAKLQLEHLSARLMEVQEEERTRLSRELHDEIVQNLAVLKMEIREAQALATRGSDAREPLARARKLADTTVQEVRNISVLLRPSLLDDLGLGPALQWQTEEFTRRTGVPCTLKGEVADDLPDAVKTCVYRVTQEALRNCEKHSRATDVCVTVTEGQDSLEVVVEDNGTGFAVDRARRPTSLGVLGMKERASALGGVLQTSNRPNGGAMVRLSVPLARVQQKEVHA
jgi:signal transduction histidine kinase